MFLFYDAPSPPDGVFDKFKEIGPTDTTKTWDSYNELVCCSNPREKKNRMLTVNEQLKNNDFFILKGQRYLIGTETTPLPGKNDVDILQTYYDHWFNITNSVLDVTGVLGSMALQPMPRAITQKAKDMGGVSYLSPYPTILQTESLIIVKDMIDFPTDQDYIIFELDFSYGLPMDDEKVDAAHQNLYKGLGHLISNYIDEGRLPDVYRPLFMNDAYQRQDYWDRLRTKEEGLQIQDRYDPDGFWQKRTSGGFRLKP